MPRYNLWILLAALCLFTVRGIPLKSHQPPNDQKWPSGRISESAAPTDGLPLCDATGLNGIHRTDSNCWTLKNRSVAAPLAAHVRPRPCGMDNMNVTRWRTSNFSAIVEQDLEQYRASNDQDGFAQWLLVKYAPEASDDMRTCNVLQQCSAVRI